MSATFYTIQPQGASTVVTCTGVSNDAEITTQSLSPSPNCVYQGWEFCAVIGTQGAYNIRNGDGIYLCAESASANASVVGGSLTASNILWVLEPVPDTSNTYKIKLHGTSLYMTKNGTVLDLTDGSTTNANWELWIDPNYP